MRIQQFRKILLSSLTVMATAAVLVFILKLYLSPEPMSQYWPEELTRRFSPRFDLTPFDPDTAPSASLEKLFQSTEDAPRPNIVLILARDVGYGDLGCYGNPIIPTPALDRMAADGLRWTGMYAANSSPSPARASLFTGRYAHRTGVTFTLYPGEAPQSLQQILRNMEQAIAKIGALDHPNDLSILTGLPQSEITLARALKQSGYQTALFGDWELGDFAANPEFHPRSHGFDSFAGFNVEAGDWPRAYWNDDEPIQKKLTEDETPDTTDFVDQASAFIRNRDAQAPFFLVLSPPMAAHGDGANPAAGAHGQALQQLDSAVGRILDLLETQQLAENTLVLFTSAAGPITDGRTAPFRSAPGMGFEGGFRVPFLAWWPDTLPANGLVQGAASHLDLFPTLLQLAGLSLPTDRIIDGQTLSAISGTDTAPQDTTPLFLFHGNALLGLRLGEDKYLREPAPALFNVVRDPWEAYNLIQNKSDAAQKLEDQLSQWESALYENSRGWRQ